MTDKNTEKQLSGILRFFIKLFQIILYIPIQIIFIPFAIIGLIDGIYKGIIKSKKMGVSFSACRALQYKWFMHYFNIRPDPLSVAFIKKFPCESHFGLLSTLGALIISQRLFGFTTSFGKVDEPGEETFFSFAGPRVLMFDRIMEKYVDEMEQIVIPGVGFDLIALQFTNGTETLAALHATPVSPSSGLRDAVMKANLACTLGFCKPTPYTGYQVFGSSSKAFGFPGSGGSFAFADPDAEVGYAYATNKMGGFMWDDPREKSLRDAFYKCLKKFGEPMGK